MKLGVPGVDRIIKIFPTPLELAEAFALDLINHIRETEKSHKPVTIAISGGSTPVMLFSVLAGKFATPVFWKDVHFFWVDERCVPPDDPDSNYGMSCRYLLDKIDIPDTNIHRIRGEEDPETEAARYSEEIIRYTRSLNNLPVFDHIILGMGEDGHTASIFPGNQELLYSEKVYDAAIHPVSGRKRITITGKVINNADYITFLITGQSKAWIIEQIIKKKAKFPASFIIPGHGRITWLLDEKAGEFIKRQSIC